MHHGPSLRGLLMTLGIVGVCGAIAVTFFLFYLHEWGMDTVSTLADFPSYKAQTIEIDGTTIAVAIADTPALQELGLGDRDDLPQGEGMLFVFPVDKAYAFWMKDMRFSIDMVWISESGNITYMAQDVSPDTYPEDFIPTSPARYVLELPAGYAQSHDFQVGDAVRF